MASEHGGATGPARRLRRGADHATCSTRSARSASSRGSSPRRSDAASARTRQRRELLIGLETGRLPEEEFEPQFARDARGQRRRADRPAVRGLDARASGWSTRSSRARRAGIRTGLISNSWGTRRYDRAQLGRAVRRRRDLRRGGDAQAGARDLRARRASGSALAPAACVFVDDLPFNLDARRRAGDGHGPPRRPPRRRSPSSSGCSGVARCDEGPSGARAIARRVVGAGGARSPAAAARRCRAGPAHSRRPRSASGDTRRTTASRMPSAPARAHGVPAAGIAALRRSSAGLRALQPPADRREHVRQPRSASSRHELGAASSATAGGLPGRSDPAIAFKTLQRAARANRGAGERGAGRRSGPRLRRPLSRPRRASRQAAG